MALIDDEYHKLVYKILEDGYIYEDPNRKGTYRTEIDEYTISHDLTKEFPAITTKKLAWKSVVGELVWFLKGDTNIKYLLDNNINIWNEDAFRFAVKKGYPHSMKQFINGIRDGIYYDGKLLGELGPIYGDAWRKFGKGHWNKESVDQILLLILNLKKNPLASDHVVTALNPTNKEDMALQPCHYGFQIIARPLTKLEKLDSLRKIGATWFTGQSVNKEIEKWKLPSYGFTLKWNQRSVDTFLGLPFNIASYALLAHIIGKLTNLTPLKLVGSLSKVHIYDNAMEKVTEQLNRSTTEYEGAKLAFNISNYITPHVSLDDLFNQFKLEDFKLNNYNSFSSLNVPMLSYNK